VGRSPLLKREASQGEGDDVEIHEEGQPAAGDNATRTIPTAPTPGDASGADAATSAGGGTGARRRRKGKVRRRARRVTPADPCARAAKAAAALADLEPAAEPAAEETPAPDAGNGDTSGDEPVPSFDPAELAAACAAPVFRVALKGAALALRGRFPAAAADFYGKAQERADALEPTLGVRVAAALGMKLPILAVIAEIAEPFLADRWESGKAGRSTVTVG
jgi:hypothetical protein